MCVVVRPPSTRLSDWSHRVTDVSAMSNIAPTDTRNGQPADLLEVHFPLLCIFRSMKLMLYLGVRMVYNASFGRCGLLFQVRTWGSGVLFAQEACEECQRRLAPNSIYGAEKVIARWCSLGYERDFTCPRPTRVLLPWYTGLVVARLNTFPA